jgi:hypothetical protein
MKKEPVQRTSILGLAGMQPIYGQVIQSAPTWSGPVSLTPIPNQVLEPKKPSLLGQVLGTIGEGLVGGACFGFLGEASLIGAAACPTISGLANQKIQSWF